MLVVAQREPGFWQTWPLKAPRDHSKSLHNPESWVQNFGGFPPRFKSNPSKTGVGSGRAPEFPILAT